MTKTKSNHLCNLKGFGAIGDVCPACEEIRTEQRVEHDVLVIRCRNELLKWCRVGIDDFGESISIDDASFVLAKMLDSAAGGTVEFFDGSYFPDKRSRKMQIEDAFTSMVRIDK